MKKIFLISASVLMVVHGFSWAAENENPQQMSNGFNALGHLIDWVRVIRAGETVVGGFGIAQARWNVYKSVRQCDKKSFDTYWPKYKTGLLVVSSQKLSTPTQELETIMRKDIDKIAKRDIEKLKALAQRQATAAPLYTCEAYKIRQGLKGFVGAGLTLGGIKILVSNATSLGKSNNMFACLCGIGLGIGLLSYGSKSIKQCISNFGNAETIVNSRKQDIGPIKSTTDNFTTNR